MAYIRATKLPDRYKVVFHNDKTGDRQRVFIDAIAFSPIKTTIDLEKSLAEAIRNKDSKAEVAIKRELAAAKDMANETHRAMFSAYSPGPDYRMWYVPFIETFDTLSKDLEEGMMWEGRDRHGVERVMWRQAGGEFQSANVEEVIISRKNDVPETIERKPR